MAPAHPADLLRRARPPEHLTPASSSHRRNPPWPACSTDSAPSPTGDAGPSSSPGWLILVLGGIGAVTLGGQTSNTFSIPGQESTIALDKISEEFGAGDGNASARVVIQAPAGQTLTSPRTPPRSAPRRRTGSAARASPAPAIR